MQEQWIRWEPIEKSKGKFRIDNVSNAFNGLSIMLTDLDNMQRKIQFLFKNSVNSYRDTNESFRQKTILDLRDKYGADFYAQWTFFKVNNSAYMEWIIEQSVGFGELLSFIHFSFIAEDSIVDVVSTYEPEILLIENNG